MTMRQLSTITFDMSGRLPQEPLIFRRPGWSFDLEALMLDNGRICMRFAEPTADVTRIGQFANYWHECGGDAGEALAFLFATQGRGNLWGMHATPTAEIGVAQ